MERPDTPRAGCDEGKREQVKSRPIDGATLSPDGQGMLKKYMRQVQADLANTKNAATKRSAPDTPNFRTLQGCF